MRYLFRRLVSALVLLLVISVTIFALSELAPGDFLSALELDPLIGKETVEVLRQRYGLDRSPLERYAAWTRSVVAGDFGFSLDYKMPVGQLLAPRARNTLVLTVSANVLAWTLALALGTWTAWRVGSWIDRLTLALVAVLLAVPPLLLALLCLFWAAAGGYFPLGGMTSIGFAEMSRVEQIRDLAWHLALPVTALVLGHLPIFVRHVRSALLEALDAPFVRGARGHGIPPWRLVLFYALPAAANPLISLFGFSVATLLSGALVVEIVMSWPGMGPLLIEAILARDLHVVLGATLASALVVVAGQLAADLLLVSVDPRIRSGS